MSQENIHKQHLALARHVVKVLAESGAPSDPLTYLVGVYLVGSVARGVDGDQSDVDVVVTHDGPEETFPFAFLDSVCASLEKARIPQRPWRTRRSEKYPGAVHIFTRSEELFQHPDLISEDFASDRLRMNTVHFWESRRSEAIKLYSITSPPNTIPS